MYIHTYLYIYNYTSATRPSYHASLSDDSKRSLLLQGGVFSPEQAEAFITLPGSSDAVRLRLWDDGRTESFYSAS